MCHFIRFAFVGYLFIVSLFLQMRFLHHCPLVDWGNLGLPLFLFTTVPPSSLSLLRSPSLLQFLPDVSLICLSFLVFYSWYLIFLSLISFSCFISWQAGRSNQVEGQRQRCLTQCWKTGWHQSRSGGTHMQTLPSKFFWLLLISFLSLLIRLRHGDFPKASDLWEM